MPQPPSRCTIECVQRHGYFVAPEARYSRTHLANAIEPVISHGFRQFGMDSCLCSWSDAFMRLLLKRMGWMKWLFMKLRYKFGQREVLLNQIRGNASTLGSTFYSYLDVVRAANSQRIAWDAANPKDKINWSGLEETLIMTSSGFRPLTSDDLKISPKKQIRRRKTVRDILQEPHSR